MKTANLKFDFGTPHIPSACRCVGHTFKVVKTILSLAVFTHSCCVIFIVDDPFCVNLQARTRPSLPVRASGSQEEASTSSQQQAQDPEDNIYEEFEREDQLAAEHINGRARVFDLFPPPPPKLTTLEQKQRAYKLSGRPLRQRQISSQSQVSRRRRGGQ